MSWLKQLLFRRRRRSSELSESTREHLDEKIPADAILLFAVAARVSAKGPDPLTMDHNDAIATARAFPHAHIFPVHHHGWEHFSESQQTLIHAFAANDMAARLHPLHTGVTVHFEP